MALIVEDGTMVSGADSYFSLADGAAYAALRGLTFPSSGTAAEQAARRGSTYIDWAFNSRFPGRRRGGRNQSFEWPRVYASDAFPTDGVLYDTFGTAIPEDEVPTEVKNAAIEAAVRELASPNSLLPDFTASAVKKRVRVGDLEVEYASASIDPNDSRPIVPMLAAILRPILVPFSGAGVMVAERM